MEERRITIRHRGARIAVLAAILLLSATFAWPVERPPSTRPTVTLMTVQPVPLDPEQSDLRRVGALTFLEGWWLRSEDVRFGGISGIHVAGRRVTAVSDAGSIFRFALPRPGQSALPLRIDRLVEGPGSGRRKGDRDAESLAVAGSHAWIAYEGRNEVWRYSRRDGRAEAAAAPEAMRRWPAMRGAETMLRLPGGRFLLIAEGHVARDGTTPALLFAGDPAVAGTAAEPLRYRPPPAFRPTDAAFLPDGRIVVLNRRFDWFDGVAAALTLIDGAEVRPGAVLQGREIARIEGRLTGGPTVDNMEALSVTSEGGRTILWIASDDNLNPLLQRTLLMKFALTE